MPLYNKVQEKRNGNVYVVSQMLILYTTAGWILEQFAICDFVFNCVWDLFRG